MFERLRAIDTQRATREARIRLRTLQQRREQPIRRRSMRQGMARGLFAGALLGAAGMFIFDPRTGRRRRALVRDKVVHLRHSAADLVTETIPKKASYLSGVARGITHRATELVGGNGPAELHDHTITDRVMSQVFRDPEIPKGTVNVDTVNRVVYLRGHLKDEALAKALEERTRKVEGVRKVVNLINRPDIDPSELHPGLEDRAT